MLVIIDLFHPEVLYVMKVDDEDGKCLVKERKDVEPELVSLRPPAILDATIDLIEKVLS